MFPVIISFKILFEKKNNFVYHVMTLSTTSFKDNILLPLPWISGQPHPWPPQLHVQNRVSPLLSSQSASDLLDYSFWFYQIYLADEHKLEELTDFQVKQCKQGKQFIGLCYTNLESFSIKELNNNELQSNSKNDIYCLDSRSVLILGIIFEKNLGGC